MPNLGVMGVWWGLKYAVLPRIPDELTLSNYPSAIMASAKGIRSVANTIF